jgi:preprotein translocase subunit SecE
MNVLTADRIKIIAATTAFVAGLVAYYLLADKPQIIRVLALAGGTVAAAAVFFQTTAGRMTWGFIRESRVEMRKVVWPNRKETMQMTVTVMALVLVAALFLWVVDWGLSLIVRALTGQGA